MTNTALNSISIFLNGMLTTASSSESDSYTKEKEKNQGRVVQNKYFCDKLSLLKQWTILDMFWIWPKMSLVVSLGKTL